MPAVYPQTIDWIKLDLERINEGDNAVITTSGNFSKARRNVVISNLVKINRKQLAAYYKRSWMKIYFLMPLIIVAVCFGLSDGQTSQTEIRPVIFAPGIISGPANDGAPTFTPDGKTLYFARSGGSWGFIMESHLISGVWAQPKIASFSGLWSDLQPALSPDGKRLVFISKRPQETNENSKSTPNQPNNTPRGAAMWEITRTAQGWSEPARLPETVNISPRVFKPSIAADGSLYFMAKTNDNKTFRLFRAQYKNGTYEQAEPLSFSDGNTTDVDPEVAPDESFLIFSSAGRASPEDTHEHLYIVFKQGVSWGTVRPLRYTGDYEKNPSDDGEANLSPDLRTLYFNSSRTVPIRANRTREEAAVDFERLNLWDNSNSNVWTITLAPWLNELKPGITNPSRN